MRKRKSKPESKVKAAAAEYLAWKRQHEVEHAQSMKKLAHKRETDAEYFTKRASVIAEQRRVIATTAGSKPEPILRQAVGGIDTSDLTLEELEAFQRREEAAQAEIALKKARTGPVYNKGNMVYLSDDLLKDVQAGNTRRRS